MELEIESFTDMVIARIQFGPSKSQTWFLMCPKDDGKSVSCPMLKFTVRPAPTDYGLINLPGLQLRPPQALSVCYSVAQ